MNLDPQHPAAADLAAARPVRLDGDQAIDIARRLYQTHGLYFSGPDIGAQACLEIVAAVFSALRNTPQLPPAVAA